MFKFLKEKLSKAISSTSEKIEEEGTQEEQEMPVEQPQEPVEEKKEETVEQKPEEDPQEEEKEEVVEDKPSEEEEPEEEKKGFLSSIKSVFKKKEEEAEEIEAEPIKEQEAPAIEVESQPEELPEPTKEDKPLKKEDLPDISLEDKKEEVEQKIEIESHEPAEPVKVEEKEVTEVVREVEEEKQEEVEKPEPVVEEEQPSVVEPQEKEIPAEEPVKEEGAVVEKKPIVAEEAQEEPKEEKKGFFSRMTEKVVTTKISEKQFEDIFFDLELAMLENNVAVEVIEKIKSDLHTSLVETPIRRNKIEETVVETLRDSVQGLFETPFDLIEAIKAKQEKPYVVAFVGINGSGKTTSISKVAHMLKEQGLSVVLAAGDTFRAASIEQLEIHGNNLGIKVIKHDYGSDPAAVAFDAIKHAQAKNADVVLVDTAGRMHKNSNLIDEMKKIVRVAKPDLKIFVGESITGNDCVEQAQTFNEAVEIDGIILSKADIDEKGGAAVSVSYVTKKPILYLGMGQEYKDLKAFDSATVVEGLGL